MTALPVSGLQQHDRFRSPPTATTPCGSKSSGLQPRTTYYYRFLLVRDNNFYASVKGRTRTAPTADDDQPVKFAFWSCQDYEGRYYNAWQRLSQLDDNLDFVLGLGDYVYEKVAATPAPGARSVSFSEPAGAIAVGHRLAAATLSQYRDLYKRYRSDAVLQKVHERYPMILMWDDHEYANDCYGASSTDQRRQDAGAKWCLAAAPPSERSSSTCRSTTPQSPQAACQGRRDKAVSEDAVVP
jgi:phosphodiesterase/alkaline phosphatase D-like protein